MQHRYGEIAMSCTGLYKGLSYEISKVLAAMLLYHMFFFGGGVRIDGLNESTLQDGVFLGNPEDSAWEDWGTVGKIRGITTPP